MHCKACNALLKGVDELCPECTSISKYEVAQVAVEIEDRQYQNSLTLDELEDLFIERVLKYGLYDSWLDGLGLEDSVKRADRLFLGAWADFKLRVDYGQNIIVAFNAATGRDKRGEIK